MMKKLKLLTLLLVMITSFAMLYGCGKKDTKGESKKQDEQVENFREEFEGNIKAEKICSVELEGNVRYGNYGIIYGGANDKYGIVSLDGKSKTDVKYTICEYLGQYFKVMTAEASSITDIPSLNCVGVVDATGKEIIPMKYATIRVINERYMQVYEVTEQTYNQEEALVEYSDNRYPVLASEGETYFKGQWYIYDVFERKMVKGVSVTNSRGISGFGDIITYTNDDNERISVNHKGEKLPERANVFLNGCYALTKNDKGAVYNSENNKLFDYKMDDFVPTASVGQYILASKNDNNKTTYVLMDLNGNIVSAEFAEYPAVLDELVRSDDKIYNFAGEKIIDGTYEQFYYEKKFGGIWILKDDINYTMIKKDGTILWKGDILGDISVDTYTSFSIEKEDGDKNLCYSMKDKDFTIEGNFIGPWLVEVMKEDNTKDVVNSYSGETVLSGYQRYFFIGNAESGYYIYAMKISGKYDVYSIK